MRKSGKADQGQLRVIGGAWRGRKLTFPALPGLRPTPDRIRETLFNWLSPALPGARCLDLFAGSGALGLEALSRGAAYCDFVEVARPAAFAIETHLTTLGATHRASVHCMEARSVTAQAADIIFIDPPFDSELLQSTLNWLPSSQLLSPKALIYVEQRRGLSLPETEGFASVLRDKTSGDVRYALLSVRS